MSTFYEQVGGSEFFEELVSHFYGRVAIDPILLPMYPKDDLHEAALRLQMFLEQYWGGPSTYSEQRGHPRLRMRHSAFHINQAARDAWLKNMNAAIDEMKMDEVLRIELKSYVLMAANSMVNQPD
ncbi:MAG: hypothetical protein RL301_828 [Actinomycetota bacterium]